LQKSLMELLLYQDGPERKAGMGITKDDYAAFMRCLPATLDTFAVREPERGEAIDFYMEKEHVRAWSRLRHSRSRHRQTQPGGT
jgi:hypothetical protein